MKLLNVLLVALLIFFRSSISYGDNTTSNEPVSNLELSTGQANTEDYQLKEFEQRVYDYTHRLCIKNTGHFTKKYSTLRRLNAIDNGTNSIAIATDSMVQVSQIMLLEIDSIFQLFSSKGFSQQLNSMLNSKSYFQALQDCYQNDILAKKLFTTGLVISDVTGKIGGVGVGLFALSKIKKLFSFFKEGNKLKENYKFYYYTFLTALGGIVLNKLSSSYSSIKEYYQLFIAEELPVADQIEMIDVSIALKKNSFGLLNTTLNKLIDERNDLLILQDQEEKKNQLSDKIKVLTNKIQEIMKKIEDLEIQKAKLAS